MNRILKGLFICVFIIAGDTGFSADDPPLNKHLADSPWPAAHRNGYRQASTSFRGPEPGDKLIVEFTPSPLETVSPWLHYSEKYANGERIVWGSNITHVFKARLTDAGLKILSSLQIDENRYANMHWAHLLLPGNQLVTYNLTEGDSRRWLLKFGDDLSNPESPITQLAEFEFPKEIQGRVHFFDLLHNGRIVFYSEGGQVGTMTTGFEDLSHFTINRKPGEAFGHNHFAMDEKNFIYLYTNHRLYRIDCNDKTPKIDWQFDYDFMGINELGAGPTPTLVGFGEQDKLVFVMDNHSPRSHFIVFWRDKIPADWPGFMGSNRRIAAIVDVNTKPPGGSFFGVSYSAVESSPSARGYDIAVAQNNGFAYYNHPCPTLRGVQKFRWNPKTRRLNLIWENTSVNMNGVMTYSEGSNLLYSSGRNATSCAFHFYGLDWDTGEVVINKKMGDSQKYFDGGNTALIGNVDRRLIFSTEKGLLQIRIEK